MTATDVRRLRSDWQATVKIGEVSRGGLPRGDQRACEHDLGVTEKYLPCGIGEEDTAPLPLPCGNSSKTSACIVDALASWGAAVDETEQVAMARLQMKRDNGPDSRGRWTQFLKRRVEFCDRIGKPIPLLYYPPYHRKYHPIERCWGSLELPWNGTQLVEVETMLVWAKSMTWKGSRPLDELSQNVDQKGVTLGKKARRAVEARLERHPELPIWDILIRPASTS